MGCTFLIGRASSRLTPPDSHLPDSHLPDSHLPDSHLLSAPSGLAPSGLAPSGLTPSVCTFRTRTFRTCTFRTCTFRTHTSGFAPSGLAPSVSDLRSHIFRQRGIPAHYRTASDVDAVDDALIAAGSGDREDPLTMNCVSTIALEPTGESDSIDSMSMFTARRAIVSFST